VPADVVPGANVVPTAVVSPAQTLIGGTRNPCG
jgi:hypothetical protein